MHSLNFSLRLLVYSLPLFLLLSIPFFFSVIFSFSSQLGPPSHYARASLIMVKRTNSASVFSALKLV